jgi:UDP-glucuronate 4-epimerase
MTILVTGAAGFIGFHTTKALLERGDIVVGIDSINDYYDVNLKLARIKEAQSEKYTFIQLDMSDRDMLFSKLSQYDITSIIHLGAQAGVRYSLENPLAYVQSNVVGFTNILEFSRERSIKHLVYASTSSVYGANKKIPYVENDRTDQPIQFYAATKKANELMAHSYSHLFGIPTSGLRFFTVYGPWGRPDMALFKFTKNILSGEPIDVYNHGKHTRDFTYVTDIVEGVVKIHDKFIGHQGKNKLHAEIFNIGSSSPVQLMDYIKEIEICLKKKSKINLLPLQPGDIEDTYADTTKLYNAVGYRPKTTVQEGVKYFVDWYLQYYHRS